MRKMVLGLAVLVGLMCVEAFGYMQEQIKDYDKQCKDGNSRGSLYRVRAISMVQRQQKAKFYFEKVCKKGNEKDKRFAEACGNLGVLYYNMAAMAPHKTLKKL